MSQEPRTLNRPEPGHWKIRLAKGAPWVSASIQWVQTDFEPDEPTNKMLGTRSRFMAAFIDGKPVGMDAVWHRKGEPITKAEHDYMVANAEWARQHAPDEAIAKPQLSLNLSALPPVYQRRSA